MSARRGVTPKRWSEEDDALLRRLYSTNDAAALAAALGRQASAVRTRCWTLGIHSKSEEWASEDIEAIRGHYNAHESSPLELEKFARSIGRTADAVALKASRLGLTNPKRKRVEAWKVRRKTASAEELLELQKKNARERIAKNGHPRGALGMRHTDKTRASQSARTRAMWADPSSKFNSEECRQKRSDNIVERIRKGKGIAPERVHSRAKRGRRLDLGGMFFRSRWEANYARYLNLLVHQGAIAEWLYEPCTFWFDAIKRGVRSYLPDFELVYRDGRRVFHEVKGWMDAKSKTRLRRMAIYWPEFPVEVIDAAWFKAANRSGLASVIDGWESETSR